MIIFVILGAIFAVIGLLMIFMQLRLRRICTIPTQGTVVGMKKRTSETTETDHNGNDRSVTKETYAPIFKYYVDGREIIKQSSVSSNANFETGATVTIFYNPAKTEESYVLEDKAAQYVGIFFAAFGFIFIAVGLMITMR